MTNRVNITKIAQVILGGTPSTSVSSYWNGDIPWASVVDFKADRFLYKTEKTITESGLKNSNTKLLNRKDIIISARGTVGKVVQCAKPMAFNQSCYALRVLDSNIISQDFLFYLLKFKILEFKQVAIGGVFDTITMSTFEKMFFPLPPLPIQKKIAAVFSAYDDLIENNNRRIAILEKMAEEIYREWFVRMRFPGHEKVKFYKGVPEGWEQQYFKNFCILQRGFDLPESRIVAGSYPVIASTSIKAYHNQFKTYPPVITTGRSGSLGTVLMVTQKAWPLNTSLWVKNMFGNSPLLIFYTLKCMKLENFNSGAGVPTLNRNHLNSLKLIVPPKNIQIQFNDKVSVLLKHKDILAYANKLLKRSRDLLLSRLISGKLSVEGLDIKFPPSMVEDLGESAKNAEEK